MKESINEVQEIVQEIEGKKLNYGAAELTTEDVIKRLLGRNVQSGEDNNIYKQNPSIVTAKSKLEQINKPAVWDIRFDRNVSRGGAAGKIKSFAIRAIRKMIRPVMADIVAEQARYNSINVQILNEMYATNMKQERAIHKIIKEVYSMNQSNGGDDLYKVLDYERFENNFRGSEEDIKNRQKEYLPFLKNAKNVLDIGCGRGEFLELMKENGIEASGVEMYSGFAEKCIQKGFDVVEDDGINYLETLDNDSLDAITAFQVAEHLPTSRLVELCRVAYAKLTVGGVLILETPNPTCLSIYTNSFYIDTTHTKPVHPQALSYYAAEAGFENRQIYYTNSSKAGEAIPHIAADGTEKFNEAMDNLSEKIYGSQDYALIAVK